MPDASGRFLGIVVSKLWPGHRDWEPRPEPKGEPRSPAPIPVPAPSGMPPATPFDG